MRIYSDVRSIVACATTEKTSLLNCHYIERGIYTNAPNKKSKENRQSLYILFWYFVCRAHSAAIHMYRHTLHIEWKTYTLQRIKYCTTKMYCAQAFVMYVRAVLHSLCAQKYIQCILSCIISFTPLIYGLIAYIERIV